MGEISSNSRLAYVGNNIQKSLLLGLGKSEIFKDRKIQRKYLRIINFVRWLTKNSFLFY